MYLSISNVTLDFYLF